MTTRTTLLKSARNAMLATPFVVGFAAGAQAGAPNQDKPRMQTAPAAATQMRTVPTVFLERAVMFGHDNTGAPVGVVPHAKDPGADFIGADGKPHAVQGQLFLDGSNPSYMQKNNYSPDTRQRVNEMVARGVLPVNGQAQNPPAASLKTQPAGETAAVPQRHDLSWGASFMKSNQGHLVGQGKVTTPAGSYNVASDIMTGGYRVDDQKGNNWSITHQTQGGNQGCTCVYGEHNGKAYKTEFHSDAHGKMHANVHGEGFSYTDVRVVVQVSAKAVAAASSVAATTLTGGPGGIYIEDVYAGSMSLNGRPVTADPKPPIKPTLTPPPVPTVVKTTPPNSNPPVQAIKAACKECCEQMVGAVNSLREMINGINIPGIQSALAQQAGATDRLAKATENQAKASVEQLAATRALKDAVEKAEKQREADARALLDRETKIGWMFAGLLAVGSGILGVMLWNRPRPSPPRREPTLPSDDNGGPSGGGSTDGVTPPVASVKPVETAATPATVPATPSTGKIRLSKGMPLSELEAIAQRVSGTVNQDAAKGDGAEVMTSTTGQTDHAATRVAMALAAGLTVALPAMATVNRPPVEFRATDESTAPPVVAQVKALAVAPVAVAPAEPAAAVASIPAGAQPVNTLQKAFQAAQSEMTAWNKSDRKDSDAKVIQAFKNLANETLTAFYKGDHAAALTKAIWVLERSPVVKLDTAQHNDLVALTQLLREEEPTAVASKAAKRAGNFAYVA